MNKKDIVNLIDIGDVTLEYGNNEIFIDPRSDGNCNWLFLLGYKDIDNEYLTVDDLMSDPVIDGKSINEICGELELA